MAAYTEKKDASEQVNQDADRKSTELKNTGVLLTSKTKEVSSADEAKQIGNKTKQLMTKLSRPKRNGRRSTMSFELRQARKGTQKRLSYRLSVLHQLILKQQWSPRLQERM